MPHFRSQRVVRCATVAVASLHVTLTLKLKCNDDYSFWPNCYLLAFRLIVVVAGPQMATFGQIQMHF